MFYEEMRVTVDRAAELLPEPPCPGSAEVYERWEALTLDAGRRLARLLNADIGLLRTLMDDEFSTPARCRQRRRMLLRVAVLAACQPVKRETVRLGALRRRTPVEGIFAPRQAWLDASF
jgi:hypothetical protein